jgi:glycosyltransferase involved in cell wall biosynthesis
MPRIAHGLELLFITPARFYPEARRGASRSAVELLRRLATRGWTVEAICGTASGSAHGQDLRRACSKDTPTPDFVVDDDLGFPCWRGAPAPPAEGQPDADWLDQLSEVDRHAFFLRPLLSRLQARRPDLVVAQMFGGPALLAESVRRGVPGFFLDRDVTPPQGSLGDQLGLAGVHRIANSPLVASWLVASGHPDPGVVLPIVEPERYRVDDRERRFITFINPIREKGVGLAVEIARRMPEAQFLFVHVKRAVGASERRTEYGSNVVTWDETEDARDIYRVTDILLHPSQWEEPFGRVILEAQASGIPVVSSDAGGIPFALGRGGVLIPRNRGSQPYVEALRRLRSDPDHYARTSALALENSARPDLAPERQVDEFEAFVRERLARSTSAVPLSTAGVQP